MAQTEKGKSITGPSLSVQNFGELQLPRATEKPHEAFVTYGADNLFPIDLIESWLEGPTHNALVVGISAMIAGDDVVVTGASLEANVWAKRVNRNRETLKDLVSKTAFDLYLHGYFGWEVIWNQGRTQIKEIYHVPAETIRSGKANEDGQIEEYFVSYDWSQYRKEKFKPKVIKAFDASDRSIPNQMIFVKQYRPSQYYYSTPSYIGAMNWILLENRVSEFHLNNIENGFFPSSIVQFFNGEPPQEEKTRIERGFMEKFSGKKQSKLVFVWNENREQEVTFQTHEPAQLHNRFREMMPQVINGIMVGHRVVSPMLFGVKDNTGFGNNADEIQSASILMNKTVIIPFQNIIIGELDEIFKINGWDAGVTIETLQPAQFIEGDDTDAEAEFAKFSAMDKRQVMSDEMAFDTVEYFDTVGESMDDLIADGWELAVEDEEVTELGSKYQIKPDQFAVGFNPSSVDAGSGDLDGFYLVRYQYKTGTGLGADIIPTTRFFCASMMAGPRKRNVYTHDAISKMTNPTFGSYSIFDYKGSYGCRHRWDRLVFIKTVAPNTAVPDYKVMPKGAVPSKFMPADDTLAQKVNPKPKK